MGETRVRRIAGAGQARPAGFAHILLLVAVAVIGIVAGSSLSLGALMSRRDAEQSLLAIGLEFEVALLSYAGIPPNAIQAPVVHARGPRSLEALLKDPRNPGLKRHLRQIYADPLTGQAEWGLLKDPAGSIVGIYSLAEGVPIKRSGFNAAQSHFEEAKSYEAWVFGLPTVVPGTNGAATVPGPGLPLSK